MAKTKSKAGVSNATFATLTSNAVNAVSGFINGEKSRLTSHTTDLYRAIADVVAVRYARPKHPVAYSDFITNSGVRVTDAKSLKASVLVKALFPKEYWKDYAAKISQYSQTVTAIETLALPLEDIADWLEEAEDVYANGKPLKGIAKARAYFRIQTGKGKRVPKTANPKAAIPVVTLGSPVDVNTFLTFDNIRFFIGRTDDAGTTEIHEIPCDPETLLSAIGVIESLALAA